MKFIFIYFFVLRLFSVSRFLQCFVVFFMFLTTISFISLLLLLLTGSALILNFLGIFWVFLFLLQLYCWSRKSNYMHRHPTPLLYIWRWNRVLQILWFCCWVVLLWFNHLHRCNHYHHCIWPLAGQLSQFSLSIHSYLGSYPVLWCWWTCHSHLRNGRKCHCYPVLQK